MSAWRPFNPSLDAVIDAQVRASLTALPRQVCDCDPFCGLPPCTGCGEDHGGHDHGNGVHLCRDCDIAKLLDDMLCPNCKRMRFRPGVLGGLGEYLWGERCVCSTGVLP